jgi:hypothetical protein
MADHGYSNFYTPPEFEPYQQYQQYPYEEEQISNVENTLNIFIQQSMINMQNTNQRLRNLSIQLEMIQAQIMENKSNIQSTHDGEIVEEGVVQTEEDTTLEECGVLENAIEIEPPHEPELPQEKSYAVEAKAVDNGEEVKMAEKQERLLSKEETCEQKGKKVSKAEIDRVIDKICALFKTKIGRLWTPHHLYLKFMEFLPKQRNTKDDVLSVSFWPP